MSTESSTDPRKGLQVIIFGDNLWVTTLSGDPAMDACLATLTTLSALPACPACLPCANQIDPLNQLRQERCARRRVHATRQHYYLAC